MDILHNLQNILKKYEKQIQEIGTYLWSNPEIAREEYLSAQKLISFYETEGFKISRGVAGFPTGFLAKYSNGNGKIPTVGILSDFDALPNLSIIEDTAPGHGCMHNLYAASAYGLAVILKDYLIENNIKAQIIVIGAPAEESGGSKFYFLKNGLLKNIDFYIGQHPVPHINGVMYQSHIASAEYSFEFFGKSAHAALNPEMGNNALSAAEYFNIGVNFLRGQVPQDVRINYIIQSGGVVTNIIPDYSKTVYSIRAKNHSTLNLIIERIKDIANNSARSMLCSCTINEISYIYNSLPNRVLALLAHKNASLVGPPHYTEDENKYFLNKGFGPYLEKITPLTDSPTIISGSTDEGDISWTAPWIRISLSSCPQNIGGHTKEMVDAANKSWAYKGIFKTILCSALTAIELFTNNDLLLSAKREHKKSLGNMSYNYSGQKEPSPSIFKYHPGFTLKNNLLKISLKDTILFTDLRSGKLIFSDENDNEIFSLMLQDKNYYECSLNSTFKYLKVDYEGALDVHRVAYITQEAYYGK